MEAETQCVRQLIAALRLSFSHPLSSFVFAHLIWLCNSRFEFVTYTLPISSSSPPLTDVLCLMRSFSLLLLICLCSQRQVFSTSASFFFFFLSFFGGVVENLCYQILKSMTFFSNNLDLLISLHIL